MISKVLPIKKIVFYKHGVGFFERTGRVSGVQNLKLSFKKKDMNDILKSLIVLDRATGSRVLSVTYDIQDDVEQIIKEKSINLGKATTLRDLLTYLRGFDVTLNIKGEEVTGTVIGVDYSDERNKLSDNFLSLYIPEKKKVLICLLGDITDFQIKDPLAARDLTFFLEKSISERKKDERFVNLLLEGEEHDLLISYIASAPTWRVSYRLIYQPSENKGILMGWGIVNNNLDEDLEDVNLILTTGMPISFVYDLYSPRILERPHVKDEVSALAKPGSLEQPLSKKETDVPAMKMFSTRKLCETCDYPVTEMAESEFDLSGIAEKTALTATGEKEGFFFKYTIPTSVTIKRGQSAMVPILNFSFDCLKERIYKAKKGEKHPYLILSFNNSSPYILEGGPVTILENDSYKGEAIVPFVSKNQHVRLPYAIDMEVTVKEDFCEYDTFNTFIFTENTAGNYLFSREVFHTSESLYSGNNTSDEAVTLIIEHIPYEKGYELFDTLEPVEKTENHIIWKMVLPPRTFQILKVKERKKVWRNEYYNNLSMEKLNQWLKKEYLSEITYNRLSDIFVFFEQIRELEKWKEKLDQDKRHIIERQEALKDQLQVLGDRGDEGTLRKKYIKNIESLEDRLDEINNEKESLGKKLFDLKKKIDHALSDLAREHKVVSGE
ncbi:MAG TPA: hypothetical protein PL110_15820 [Candidatus Eremiobacteraeota bacterium]|nr:hypothetical protein [Candidatus Eremiobacteraeota bacterium]